MEVVLRKVDPAAILRDEWLRVSQLAARRIKLQACPARNPNGRDAFVVQSGDKLVQSGSRLACDRDEIIDR